MLSSLGCPATMEKSNFNWNFIVETTVPKKAEKI